MQVKDRIYIAGRHGMIGSAIERKLVKLGYENIIGHPSNQLDLRNQQDVNHFFENEKPDYVFVAAAKVGGIMANQQSPASFLYDNLMIESNIIHAAYLSGAKKLLFLGSSCIYPKMAAQPLKEEFLLTGLLEPTNEFYAIAKIAGIKLCDAYRKQYGSNFISAMPCNLYGPNDNYHLVQSHVIPALMQKIHDAKTNGISTVEVWGTGKPLREFLHVDDAASACIFMMLNYNDSGFLNVGSGEEISIGELSALIAQIVGYKGGFIFDSSKPDGTQRKLMDSSRLNSLGWRHQITLHDGLSALYRQHFLNIQ